MSTLLERQLAREKRHRNREIVIAILLILVVFAGTWVQTSYFGSDSLVFLIFLNINAMLMLIVFYLTVRNIVKLIAERRRKVFGARLRTRLLLAFGLFSIIPVFMMYLASNRVVITSIDYWFTNTVASSMEAALEVGQSIYTNTVERLTARINYVSDEINTQLKKQESTTENQYAFVEKYFSQYEGILTGNILALVEKTPNSGRLIITTAHTSETSIFLQDIIRTTSWSSLSNQVYISLSTLNDNDYVIVLKPLNDSKQYFLVLAESLGHAAQSDLTSISKGFDDYAYLKSLNQPLKLSFTLILGLLGLLMIFSAIVMAFRLSKELTAPIEALEEGTSKIKEGELDVFLEDRGQDELGQLVGSFNSMASQVREKNENIQRTNVELARRNVFIENVLANIDTGVCVFTLEGWVVNINKAATQILGIQGNVWHEKALFKNLENEQIFSTIGLYLDKNPDKRWRRELEIIHTSKSVKILLTALNLPHFYKNEEKHEKINSKYDGNIILLIEDITELTRVERLAAWREVARRIAHEMKNPLTPIRLSAERLQKKFNPSHTEPVFNECTKLIISEVERMQDMIKNFTQYSKMPEVVLKDEDILAILEENLQIFKTSYTQIEWTLELSQDFETSICKTLLLHKQTFKQALMNIYLNAIDAVEHSQSPKITTSIKCTVDRCILAISDNGTGLDEDALAHLFDPYFTKKKSGTGLGLSIAQAILAEHNASVYAENNAIGGASVVIYLPIG